MIDDEDINGPYGLLIKLDKTRLRPFHISKGNNGDLQESVLCS